MVLFNFFKSNSSPFEKIFSFELNELFSNSEEFEVKKGGNEKIKCIKYKAKLNKIFLNYFDTALIIIASDKKHISKDLPTSIEFIATHKPKKYNYDIVANIVNTMAKICKVTDDNWRDIDESHIKEGLWRGRFFTVKKSSVFINLDEINGLTMTVTGLNNYIK